VRARRGATSLLTGNVRRFNLQLLSNQQTRQQQLRTFPSPDFDTFSFASALKIRLVQVQVGVAINKENP
jgi:hypothetical protein